MFTIVFITLDRPRFGLKDTSISGPQNFTAYNNVLTLTITNFTAQDSGTYICVSRNAVARQAKSVHVRVLGQYIIDFQ